MFRLRLRNGLYYNRDVLVQFAEGGEGFDGAVGVDECISDDFAHRVVFEEGDVVDCVRGWFGGCVYVGGVYADRVVQSYWWEWLEVWDDVVEDVVELDSIHSEDLYMLVW